MATHSTTSVTSSSQMTIQTPEKDSDMIAIMGATGTGKTTFINLVSSSNLRVGMTLHSCTSEVETSLPFPLNGRSVTLIDTPGFNDTTQSDTAILRLISEYLSRQYTEGIKLAGVIYMHRISDFRMGGISTRNFKIFRELCGDSTLKNVIIVTNMWDEVNQEIGEAREAELASDDMFFKPVLDKKARFVRHDNTLKSAQAIIQLIIGNEPRIQKGLVDERKDSSQTAAAEVLDHELIEQARRHKEEKQKVQAEMEAALKKQAEARAQEEEEQRREIARVEAEARRRATELQAENARIQREMEEATESARLEAARVAAEYQRQLQEEAERVMAEAAERAEIARQLAEAQQREAELERQRQQADSHDGGGCIIM